MTRLFQSQFAIEMEKGYLSRGTFLDLTNGSTIVYQGNVYRNDLLSYWPGVPVTIHTSEPPEASLWVYLNGEILCQATAQTFRPSTYLDMTIERKSGV